MVDLSIISHILVAVIVVMLSLFILSITNDDKVEINKVEFTFLILVILIFYELFNIGNGINKIHKKMELKRGKG